MKRSERIKIARRVCPTETNWVELSNLEKFIKNLPKGFDEEKILFRFCRTSGIGINIYAIYDEIISDITDYSLW